VLGFLGGLMPQSQQNILPLCAKSCMVHVGDVLGQQEAPWLPHLPPSRVRLGFAVRTGKGEI
jgi:hypothetical protein